MSTTPLPDDPYIALGLPPDASAADIKAAHRKLVLQFHPDKVLNEEDKKSAADEFTRIQSAFELLRDEQRRANYDAAVRLASFRHEAMLRQQQGQQQAPSQPTQQPAPSPRPDRHDSATPMPAPTPMNAEKPTRSNSEQSYFDHVPSASEPGAGVYSTRVFREYKPNKPYIVIEDEWEAFRPSSRKNTEYTRTAYKKRSDVDDGAERVRSTTPTASSSRESRESEKARRSEVKRSRDKETRRDRQARARETEFSSTTQLDDTASDEGVDPKQETRKKSGYFSKPTSRDASRDESSKWESRARSYIREATQGQSSSERRDSAPAEREEKKESRPRASRFFSTSTDYKSTSAEVRPSMSRRSSTKPRSEKDSSASPPKKDRKASSGEVPSMSGLREERRPPPLQTSTSSPSPVEFKFVRSQSMQVDGEDHAAPPTPHLRRSETMPPATSPRRSSSLRPTEYDYGLPTPGNTPDYPPFSPATGYSVKYRVSGDDDFYATSPKSSTRERERDRERERESIERAERDRRHTRSPSPLQQTSSSSTSTSRTVPPIRTTYSSVESPVSATNPAYATYVPSSATSSRPSTMRSLAGLAGQILTGGSVSSPKSPAVRVEHVYADERDYDRERARERDRDRDRDRERERERDRGRERDRDRRRRATEDDRSAGARYKYLPDLDKAVFTRKLSGTGEDGLRMASGSRRSSAATTPTTPKPGIGRSMTFAY